MATNQEREDPGETGKWEADKKDDAMHNPTAQEREGREETGKWEVDKKDDATHNPDCGESRS